MATPEISPVQDINLVIVNADNEQRYRILATLTSQGEALTHAETVLYALQNARDLTGRDAFLEGRLSIHPSGTGFSSSSSVPELIGWAGLIASIDTEDMPFERTLVACTNEEGRNSVQAAGLYAFIQEVVSVTGHADHPLAFTPNTRPPLSLVPNPMHKPKMPASESSPDEVLSCGGGEVVINVAERTVMLRGTPKKLLSRDFDMLCIMARAPERVYTRSLLLESVWGQASGHGIETINASINRIRSQLGHDFIKTTRGVGYAVANKLPIPKSV